MDEAPNTRVVSVAFSVSYYVMMTQDCNVNGVSVSTMWRGIDDSSIEEVYYFLFHESLPNRWTLPSVVRIEYVEPAILNFIKREYEATLVCATDYIPTSKPKPRNDVEAFTEQFSEQERTFIFAIKDAKYSKYPILIRLSTEREKYEFCACSFDGEALSKFVKPIAKRFAFYSDYDKDLMFGVLYPEGSRLTIKELPLDDAHVQTMNLELNYGSGFSKHHEIVMSKLGKNKRGLFIFHGIPGTGKTTYIKYLAHLFGGKRMFIFIPTTNLEMLVSPQLLPVLLDHKDSILVLEDAEKAVVSRENQLGNESLVSTLLNIGDGILGSMLNLSLFVTFNTRKDKIDSALLRKGRLQYEYEFKALCPTDAEKLLTTLGHGRKVTSPMSLADIYNITSETGHEEETPRAIGFNS